ncbi:MAG: DNA mismatch repair protein MutS [Lacrimispora sp.]
MNVFLLYRNRDFVFPIKLPEQSVNLVQDLELSALFEGMAQGDAFLLETVRTVILGGLSDVKEIEYRQMILKDCLAHREEVRALYQLSCEAVKNEKNRNIGIFSDTPRYVLEGSVKTLELFVPMLESLARTARDLEPVWQSEGFKRFFGMIREELSASYLAGMEGYLRRLKFPNGILVSAVLGKRLKAEHYTLHDLPYRKRSLMEFIFGRRDGAYGFTIADRDESGGRILSELQDEGVKDIANTLSQSCDHVKAFFMALKRELSFYIGCINLQEQLTTLGASYAFPEAFPGGTCFLSCQSLYNVSLALQLNRKIEGNTVEGDGKQLVMVTGANQGGKTTFLRSMGQACLMLQSGMFVAGEAFSASIGTVFTHFKREEDTTMKSGKLDEELERMSRIIDHITPGSLLLMNESFAATNEQEGSELAMQVVSALVDGGVRVIFVSHFYKFASAVLSQGSEKHLFLRAERQDDGSRSYRLSVGEPLTTGFGGDIYNKIFKEAPDGRV